MGFQRMCRCVWEKKGLTCYQSDAKCIRAGEYINGVEILSDCTHLYRGVRHPGLWGLQRDQADIL